MEFVNVSVKLSEADLHYLDMYKAYFGLKSRSVALHSIIHTAAPYGPAFLADTYKDLGVQGA